MNIQQIRQSLRLKWVNYYYKNRSWLVKVRVWGTYDGLRRPSSSFILATLSILEPQLEQLLPFLVELNNDPDEIVSALGLNFNPEEHLYLISLDVTEESERVSNTFLQENLFDGKSLNSSEATTEVENHNTSVLPKVESESNTVQSAAVVTLPVETKNISIPWLSYFSQEVTLQGKFFCSVDVSPELEVKRSCTIPVAVATFERSSNNHPISNDVLCDRKKQRNCEPHFAMDNDVERKSPFVTIPQEKYHQQENLLPTHQVRRLADWVDGFCQGKEWSVEDTL
jgi:hypothetical protein